MKKDAHDAHAHSARRNEKGPNSGHFLKKERYCTARSVIFEHVLGRRRLSLLLAVFSTSKHRQLIISLLFHRSVGDGVTGSACTLSLQGWEVWESWAAVRLLAANNLDSQTMLTKL